MRTFYQALGLPPSADERQIKDAYRALARRLHPDLNAGDPAGAGRMAEVNAAYATLANSEARRAYDRDLARRRAELRRRLLTMAASGAVSFALTTVVVAALVLRDAPPQPPARAGAAGAAGAGDTAAALAQSRMPGPIPGAPPADDGASLGGAREPVRATVWRTYRDPRFDFALRYPAGLFAFDAARSDAHVTAFVSRDGQAVLRIVAAENTAGITPRSYRSMLVQDRYAGAAFKQAPQHERWFALAGTLGEEVFLERVTFSCDGKSMHGWQMRYPASQRATYDEPAGLILRNHPHGNGPGPGCDEARGKRKARRR